MGTYISFAPHFSWLSIVSSRKMVSQSHDSKRRTSTDELAEKAKLKDKATRGRRGRGKKDIDDVLSLIQTGKGKNGLSSVTSFWDKQFDKMDSKRGKVRSERKHISKRAGSPKTVSSRK